MAGGGGGDSGQAANSGGGGIMGYLGGLWGAADPGALAGGGVAVPAPNAPAKAWAERLSAGATTAVASQYPGYGTLWTYDGGLAITRTGQLALGGVAVVVGLLMFGGR